MKLVDQVNISPDAIVRRVGDELVILNVGSGTYFGLDPVGARIWELLQEGKSPQQICEVMLDEYEVSQAVFEDDFTRLIKDLLAEELISVS